MRLIAVFILVFLAVSVAVSAETFNTPVLDGVIGDDWGPGDGLRSPYVGRMHLHTSHDVGC
jgi:hypothetical protein